ncbi:MAG TPA: CAAX protease [Porphyromonadaceae bacterium]|nr:CAAX protease [Porphyromonadaceae bacterium]
MSEQFCTQSQVSVEEQINRLKSEGLSFQNEVKAYHLLQNISRFRMESYFKPFRLHNSGSFKVNSTFEEAYNLYKFDAELRKIVCSELEKIEVSVRTQLSLVMGTTSSIYWFEDSSNFRDGEYHKSLLKTLREELHRSDDESIVSFLRKYPNSFPPTYITFEVSSFGTLSKIYQNLKAGQSRRQIAKFYGLSDTIMESWLHSIVYVRNICAHHSRLWNRLLGINAMIPRHTCLPFIRIPKDTKRVYYVLSIILYFLQTINPNHTFTTRFKTMLGAYPQIDVIAMGFPPDWENEPFWKTKI